MKLIAMGRYTVCYVKVISAPANRKSAKANYAYVPATLSSQHVPIMSRPSQRWNPHGYKSEAQECEIESTAWVICERSNGVW